MTILSRHTCAQAFHSRDVIPKPVKTEWSRTMSPGLDQATPGYQMSSPTSANGQGLGAPFHHCGTSVLPRDSQAEDQERKSEPRYTWADTHATLPEWVRAVGLCRSVREGAVCVSVCQL